MVNRFVKPVNAVQSGFLYLKSALSGNPSPPPMPLFVSAELTNNCNLKCPECLSGSGAMTRRLGFMDIKLYRKMLAEVGSYIYCLNIYFQGEPMMHPDFLSFLVKEGNYRLIVSTNGHFLTPENAVNIVRSDLDKLIISLDGMDQKTYSAYRRNGDLGKVINGIRNAAGAKRRHISDLKIEIQFLVNNQNEHQIAEARRFAREVRATLRLKSMQIANECSMEEWQPSSWKFRRYFKRGGRYYIKSSLPDSCGRMWFNPVITWDGKVVPCCFDKNAQYVMGDLNTDSFRNIWNSDKYNDFRRQVFADRKSIGICRNCTSGLKGVIC